MIYQQSPKSSVTLDNINVFVLFLSSVCFKFPFQVADWLHNIVYRFFSGSPNVTTISVIMSLNFFPSPMLILRVNMPHLIWLEIITASLLQPKGISEIERDFQL